MAATVSDDLFRRTCSDAADAAAAVALNVRQLAAAVREYDRKAAAAGMTRLAQDLPPLAGVMHQLHMTSRVAIQPTPLKQLETWLETLVAAWTADDLLSVSDVLDYDLAPALEEWQRVLRSCSSLSKV